MLCSFINTNSPHKEGACLHIVIAQNPATRLCYCVLATEREAHEIIWAIIFQTNRRFYVFVSQILFPVFGN